MSFDSGGDTEQVTKEQSTSTVSPDIHPYFFGPQGLAPRAEAASLAVPNTPYAGPFFSAVDPREREALGLTEGVGRAALPNLFQGQQAGQDLALAQLRGDYLKPESNPYLKSTIDAATRPVTEGFRENVLPALEGRAFLEGAGDSIRLPLAIAQAGRDYERNVGDISSNIAYSNYGAERNIQQNAPNLLAAATGLPLQAINLIGGAGAGERGLNEIEVQEGLAQRAEAERAPFAPLNAYANILGTIPAGSQSSGTTTTNTTTEAPGAGLRALTGALGAAQIGLGAYGAFPNMFGGGGAASPASYGGAGSVGSVGGPAMPFSAPYIPNNRLFELGRTY